MWAATACQRAATETRCKDGVRTRSCCGSSARRMFRECHSSRRRRRKHIEGMVVGERTYLAWMATQLRTKYQVEVPRRRSTTFLSPLTSIFTRSDSTFFLFAYFLFSLSSLSSPAQFPRHPRMHETDSKPNTSLKHPCSSTSDAPNSALQQQRQNISHSGSPSVVTTKTMLPQQRQSKTQIDTCKPLRKMYLHDVDTEEAGVQYELLLFLRAARTVHHLGLTWEPRSRTRVALADRSSDSNHFETSAQTRNQMLHVPETINKLQHNKEKPHQVDRIIYPKVRGKYQTSSHSTLRWHVAPGSVVE